MDNNEAIQQIKNGSNFLRESGLEWSEILAIVGEEIDSEVKHLEDQMAGG